MPSTETSADYKWSNSDETYELYAKKKKRKYEKKEKNDLHFLLVV